MGQGEIGGWVDEHLQPECPREFIGQDGKKGRALSMPAAALQAYLAEHVRDMSEPTLRYQKGGAAR